MGRRGAARLRMRRGERATRVCQPLRWDFLFKVFIKIIEKDAVKRPVKLTAECEQPQGVFLPYWVLLQHIKARVNTVPLSHPSGI